MITLSERAGAIGAENIRATTVTTTTMKKRTNGVEREKAAACEICFNATLYRPAVTGKTVLWTFLTLPKEASSKLASRGQVTVEGTINSTPFQSTLEPDGKGGHWLRVDEKLRKKAGAAVGDVVTLEIAPMGAEPEPSVPADLKKALASAASRVRDAWSDITPAARRDFIHWIVSPKKAETRAKRIATACDMLAKGKRRPCCFDRSGMYDKSLSCPVAEDKGYHMGRVKKEASSGGTPSGAPGVQVD